MRVLLVLILLTLSGCTSGGNVLDGYLMRPSEAPDGCSLLDMASPEGQDITELTGMASNPGSFNASFFEADDIVPLSNRVVLYDCGGDMIVSAAQRFASPAEAEAWTDARIRCDESPTFQDGAIVGAIEPVTSDWEADQLASARSAAQRIMAQTGAQDLCPL